mmetsp:Transcript_40017/g.115321  ORF Transcript_40017/g.115321 Transcript_40017/m.115321 type:complete len:271 (+) Transcript_40017:599-1411(+)
MSNHAGRRRRAGLSGREARRELAVHGRVRAAAQVPDQDRRQAGVLRALDDPLDAPVVGPVRVEPDPRVPLGLGERVALLHVAARAHPQLQHQLQPVPRRQGLQAAVHGVRGAPQARGHVDGAGVPGAGRPVLALHDAPGAPRPAVHHVPGLPQAGVQDGPEVLHGRPVVRDGPAAQALLGYPLRRHDVQLRPAVRTEVGDPGNGLDDLRAEGTPGKSGLLLGKKCRFEDARPPRQSRRLTLQQTSISRNSSGGIQHLAAKVLPLHAKCMQ